MTPSSLSSVAGDDATLVAQSLAGSRQAFTRIVERYQSLICALGYSATGSVSRSEDLAQETFVTAWKQLAMLREPAKLRAWLCGIARNHINGALRRQVREPAHAAASLDEAREIASSEPAPVTQVISAEEMTLLWREVGQLPDTYREALVLFYREHQSLTKVAEALELTEDAAAQRLSRGRSLLRERMLAFVEGALERTNPGVQFSAGVEAALPVLVAGSQGAAAMVSVKGLAAKGSGLMAALAWLAMPLVGVLTALGLNWVNIRAAQEGAEKRSVVRWTIFLWVIVGALMMAFGVLNGLSEQLHWEKRTHLLAGAGVWVAYLVAFSALMVANYRRTVGKPAVEPSPRRTAGVVAAVYIASAAWIIGFTWVIGDRTVAGIMVLLTVGLAAENIRRVRQVSAEVRHLVIAKFNGLFCVLLLAIVNLRVDRWLATLYQLSLPEVHAILPMRTVHLLTAGVLGWTALLLVLTRPRARST